MSLFTLIDAGIDKLNLKDFHPDQMEAEQNISHWIFCPSATCCLPCIQINHVCYHCLGASQFEMSASIFFGSVYRILMSELVQFANSKAMDAILTALLVFCTEPQITSRGLA